jgi:hypothetical protein
MILAAGLGMTGAAAAALPTSPADTNELCGAWKDLGIEPTPSRVELSGAVASYETGYGKGWRKGGVDSHNWGAIHKAVPTCPDGTKSARCLTKGRPTCPKGTFLHKDSDSSGPYYACFLEYQTPREAARHFVHVLIHRNKCREVPGALSVLDALDSGDSYKLAQALWATCFFTTHVGAPDADARIAEYAAALERHRTVRACPTWMTAPMASAPAVLPGVGAQGVPATYGDAEADSFMRAILDAFAAATPGLYCSADPETMTW